MQCLPVILYQPSLAIASGYVGQLFGTESTGTGGSGYSSGSTTIATTSLSSIISLTLDKGIYLIGIFVRQTKAANANADRVYGNIQVGGTTVHSVNIIQSTSTASSGGTMSLNVTMPIRISTDSTVVRFWGATAVDNATAGDNLIYAVRIA